MRKTLDQLAKDLGAIEKREYSSWNNSFEFYLLSRTPNPHNGCYDIYRFIPSLNSSGSWQVTLGSADWVEQSRVIDFTD